MAIAKNFETNKRTEIEITLCNVKTYYIATVFKTVCYQQRTHQWDRRVNPGTDPRDIWQRCKSNSMDKRQSFHQMMLEQLDVHR